MPSRKDQIECHFSYRCQTTFVWRASHTLLTLPKPCTSPQVTPHYSSTGTTEFSLFSEGIARQSDLQRALGGAGEEAVLQQPLVNMQETGRHVTQGPGCAQNSSVFPYGWASQDKSTISLSADRATIPPIFAYEDLHQQCGHRLASSGYRLRVWLN